MLALISGKPRFKLGHFPDDVQRYPPSLLAEIENALETGQLSLFSSEAVSKFEKRFASYLGAGHCIAVANGTLALVAAMKSIGLTPGDEVIVPGYSYAATRTAVETCWCKPVYVDIDSKNWCIDLNSIPEQILRTAKAIIVVHIFGCPCNMDDVVELGEKYNLQVIEDCAQSTGAAWCNKLVGSFGIGCHSFMQNKIVRTGEGGAVTTDNPVLAESVRRIRHEGEIWSRFDVSTSEPREVVPNDLIYGIEYPISGMNLRMSAIEGLIGCCSLDKLEDELKLRERNAETLNGILENTESLVVQDCPPEGKRVWWSYVCEVKSSKFNRDVLIAACAAEGIPVGIHFPIPLWRSQGNTAGKSDLPNTMEFCQRQIAFPINASLSENHIVDIGETILDIIRELNNVGAEIQRLANRYLNNASIVHMIGGAYFTTEHISKMNIG